MATVYCEFCGDPAADNIREPVPFVRWMHGKVGNVVRCYLHSRTSKLSPICRTHNPFTGEHRGKYAGQIHLHKSEYPEGETP